MDRFPPPSMMMSPQSPSTTPTGPPNGPFRPRRSEDWHVYRETIEQLYRSDQLKLRDVKRIMEREHNFAASEKQYKDRLAAWNIRKNIKAAEVQVMIRKKQKRAARGKQTAFRRAGQDVDPKRLTRFVRRYGTQWEKNPDKDADLQSPEPKTPSDMSCYTPEPEEGAATPISPPDVQSPTRETPPYPMNYDPTNLATMPDLVIASDDEPYAMNMHHQHQHQHQQRHSHSHPNPPRRVYHPSELTHPQPHPSHHPSVHSMLHSPITHDPHAHHHHSQSQAHHQHQHQHHQHHNHHGHILNPIHPVHPPVTAIPSIAIPAPISSLPPSISSPAPTPTPISIPVSLSTPVTAMPVSIVPGYDGWRLDVFQNRLEGLQYELDRSMSKWAREQDPNQEIPGHHEGLGQ
ncbi:hypothetical protein N7466_003098 [Penicillium verhagenii]|uniref:uncharacterized protein n=1 Tax=Penicillium verhagenii TaxID=1562060 RepID=UPI00254551B5|nr:uncharacterized protein N7466_003098 [Penicillium verhagenii]KAJ5936648.1 hypothetical protein N7466_003098 [Penicillium verhagenii]